MMPEATETVIPIYGGKASVDYRADGQRQADDYRASLRKHDWDRIAQATEIRWWQGRALWRTVSTVSGIGIFVGLVVVWLLT